MQRHPSPRADLATAARLREARQRAGKTVDDAARACLVSAETVYNWEHGQTEPRASDLRALCLLYGTCPNALLGVTAGGIPEHVQA